MTKTGWLIPVVAMFGCAHTPIAKTAAAPTQAMAPVMAATKTDRCSSAADCGADQLCVDNRCESISQIAACQKLRVHFPFNSSELSATDRNDLQQGVACIKADSSLKVTIAGNADERGTEEYNLALGDRRANAVQKYLEDLGASQTQLKTVSYGKEDPICAQHDEACWSQNRRADLKLVDSSRPEK